RMRLRRRDRRDAHRSETPRENETPGRARGLRAGGDRPAEARGRNPRNAGSRGGFRLQEAGGEGQARKSRRARRGRHEEGGPQGGAGEDQALNLHEYQSKGIFRAAGIPVPPGDVVSNVEDALAAAERFGYPVVVKAQVLVGGRGKAGGVKVVRGGEELSREAGRILGMELRGLKVNRVLITPSAEIAREYYAGIVLDRRNESPLLMVSPAGGIDIEEVARAGPEKILRIPIDGRGLPGYRARAAARFLDKDPAVQKPTIPILIRPPPAYHAQDASLP